MQSMNLKISHRLNYKEYRIDLNGRYDTEPEYMLPLDRNADWEDQLVWFYNAIYRNEMEEKTTRHRHDHVGHLDGGEWKHVGHGIIESWVHQLTVDLSNYPSFIARLDMPGETKFLRLK